MKSIKLVWIKFKVWLLKTYLESASLIEKKDD
jgi:hypothetical protein